MLDKVLFGDGLNDSRQALYALLRIGRFWGSWEMTQQSTWRDLYLSAVLETDWRNILLKIDVAQETILERLMEISLLGNNSEEDQDLIKARHSLNTLRTLVLEWMKSADSAEPT